MKGSRSSGFRDEGGRVGVCREEGSAGLSALKHAKGKARSQYCFIGVSILLRVEGRFGSMHCVRWRNCSVWLAVGFKTSIS